MSNSKLKKVIIVNQTKVPKKYLDSVLNEEIYADFYHNGISSLLEWNISVVKDPLTKRKLLNSQKAIEDLTEYLAKFKGTIICEDSNRLRKQL